MAVDNAVLRSRVREREAPAGRQLVVVVIGIAMCASIAGVVAMRVRQEHDRLAHRHRVEAEVRDSNVVDALRNEVSQLVQIAPPVQGVDASPLQSISAALRPGLPVTVSQLLPDAAHFAITHRGRVGDYDLYTVDADRFAERDVELYKEWLSSTELIPIDPFALTRVSGAPKLRRGEVFVAVDADDDGKVNKVVVVGDDPIFSNAAAFDTEG